MARKTDGEKIDELEKVVATLAAQQHNVREVVERMAIKQDQIAQEVNDLKTKAAVIEERLTELKRSLEESSRRRWAILPAIVAAVIGSLLTLLGQFVLTYFKGHTP